MTDKEILYKVIQKLKEDGTLPDSFNSFYKHGAFTTDIIKYWINNNLIESIIFSHEFAKAFWGEEYICSFCGLNRDNPDCCNEEWGKDQDYNWEYHLKQMVLEDNPLQYLEQFLK